MAFRKKYEKLFVYNPDIVFIQECENQEKLEASLEQIDYKQLLWFGDNPHKGIGVISFQDYKIELHAEYNSDFKYIIPLSVSAQKTKMNVFVIWAMPHKSIKSKSYVGQIWDAVHYYETELNQPSILIGDFNSHVRWDKERNPGNHSGVVSFLQNKNIESCYHRFHNISQGQELDPTWYMYKHEDKPYHLDYCFASKSLLLNMSIDVGQFEEWIGLSDHMPLFVSLEVY